MIRGDEARTGPPADSGLLPSVLRRPLTALPDPLPLRAIWADVNDASRRTGSTSVDLDITPPGSKSLTNRALLLAALAHGRSTLRSPLTEADDARQMIDAVTRLGASVRRQPAADGTHVLHVEGVGGQWRVPSGGVSLNVNNAGTAMRFLAAAALLSPSPESPITLDGNPRMRERPIGELAALLRRLGAGVEFLGAAECPPLRITRGSTAPGAEGGRVLEIGRTRSSQFVSALLLVAPFMERGLAIRFTEDITSESYVEMTVGLLGRLGVRVEHDAALRTLTVPQHRLAGFELEIEPDASGATYPWAIGAVLPGVCVRVPGLSHPSLQGDARFPALLGRMGAAVSSSPLATSVTGPTSLRGIDADLSLMPDAAMTLAAVACFASSPTVLRGLRTLRDKETDRVEATRAELTKLGVRVDVGASAGPDGAADADALVITPPPGGIMRDANAPRVELDTYDDHRMAMSLSLVALGRPNTWIRNPACVAKTYPGYWHELSRVYEAVAKATGDTREFLSE